MPDDIIALFDPPIDQFGRHVASREGVRVEKVDEKAAIGRRSEQRVGNERIFQLGDRLVPACAMRDELGNHRIVERRHRTAFGNPVVDPRTRTRVVAGSPMLDRTGLRQEAAIGVFGIKPCLDRMTVDTHLVLRKRQPFARRHAQLPFDQVDPGHHLGHRMLDLQPRIHLEEIVIAVRPEHEFDRASPDIADRRCGAQPVRADHGAKIIAKRRRRRLLDHLLVPPLGRAVALAEMDEITQSVAEDLHLDMARRLDQLFEQQPPVSERALRLALRAFDRRFEAADIVDPAHAASATAGRRLDQDWVADPLGLAAKPVDLLLVAVIAGDNRHARLAHQRLGARLVAHRPDCLDGRADEGQARSLARRREAGILRQEAVAGMYGVGAGLACRVEDRIDIEIGLRRFRRPDPHGLVGQPDMQCLRIRIRVDGHGCDPHAPRRPHDAAGDLAAIGDEELADHRRLSARSRCAAGCRFRAAYPPAWR